MAEVAEIKNGAEKENHSDDQAENIQQIFEPHSYFTQSIFFEHDYADPARICNIFDSIHEDLNSIDLPSATHSNSPYSANISGTNENENLIDEAIRTDTDYENFQIDVDAKDDELECEYLIEEVENNNSNQNVNFDPNNDALNISGTNKNENLIDEAIRTDTDNSNQNVNFDANNEKYGSNKTTANKRKKQTFRCMLGKCKKRPKTFNMKCRFEAHILAHNPQFECKDCGRVYRYKTALTAHYCH